MEQMDLVEYSSTEKLGFEFFSDFIILETVYDTVRQSDIGIWRRLCALLSHPNRNFVFFANEHHFECFYIDSTASATADISQCKENRIVRAIQKAYHWYSAHLKLMEQANDFDIAVIAASNEELQALQAVQVENVLDVEKLIAPMQELCPEVYDLCKSSFPKTESGSDGNARQLYADHISMADILLGIQNKRLFQGVLKCNREYYLECHVMIASRGDGNGRVPILIQGREHINRAMDGDVVAIEILSREQWKKVFDRFETLESEKPDNIQIAEPSVPLSESEWMEVSSKCDTVSAQPMGRVVGIIRRNRRIICGSLDIAKSKGTCLFTPMDRKIPKIRIKTRQAEALMDQRLIVAIDAWPSNSAYPLGHYVKSLGKIGEKETETKVLLLTHEIPHAPFSKECLKCLPPENWTITSENSVGRTDLRHLPIMSIDPPNCQDIDDALHASLLDNGNIQVGVHIADVSHFVTPGSALDLEAANRGTSTYLVDQRLDMLPSLLTTKLCSLTSTDDHFAFSVLWEMRLTSDDVEIVNVTFCKSVIRSIASLSYDEAQVYLEDPCAGQLYSSGIQQSQSSSSQIIGSGIKTLHAIAQRLKEKRMRAGALTLASPEVRFVLDTQAQNPLDVQLYTLKDTNALVEEFMLLANITVAKKIVRHFPTISMLRRHSAPSKQQFDLLCSQTKAIGVDLRVETSKQLQKSLNQKESAHFNKILRILCTRCMMPARYIISGEVTPMEFHHYGLAAPIYTHFTSPIRRYADVIVHRLLAASLCLDPLSPAMENKEMARDLADHLNQRHRAAQMAGRASVALHTLLYFKENSTIANGVITRVRENGISVFLAQFGVEGNIVFRENDATQCVDFDAERHVLRIQTESAGIRSLQIFASVRVRVFVSVLTGNRHEIAFELLENVEKKGKKRERNG